MKKVFARIGMVLEISDDEAKRLLEETGEREGRNLEYDISDELAMRFVREGKLHADSYIPADSIWEEK